MIKEYKKFLTENESTNTDFKSFEKLMQEIEQQAQNDNMVQYVELNEKARMLIVSLLNKIKEIKPNKTNQQFLRNVQCFLLLEQADLFHAEVIGQIASHDFLTSFDQFQKMTQILEVIKKEYSDALNSDNELQRQLLIQQRNIVSLYPILAKYIKEKPLPPQIWEIIKLLKNTKESRKNSPLNFSIVYASEDQKSRISEKVIQQFITEIMQLKQAPKKRAQLKLYANRLHEHTLSIDVAFNENRNCYEMVSFETAHSDIHMEFLQNLTGQLISKKIAYDIVGCMARLQGDGISCSNMGYIFLCEAAKEDNFFANVSKYAEDPEKITAYHQVRNEKGGIDHEKKEYPRIANVRWVKTSALPAKIAILAQTPQHTTETILKEKGLADKEIKEIVDARIGKINKKYAQEDKLIQELWPLDENTKIIDYYRHRAFAKLISFFSLSDAERAKKYYLSAEQHTKLGRYQKAISDYLAAYKYFGKTEKPGEITMAVYSQKIGDCFQALEDWKNASDYFGKAKQMLEKVVPNSDVIVKLNQKISDCNEKLRTQTLTELQV